jgi:hypothetical protein
MASWRCLALLATALPLLGGCAALYAWAIPRWAAGVAACAECHESYAAWLATPRTSEAGRACAAPAHLAAVPAGVQTAAGAMVRRMLRAAAAYVRSPPR